MILVLDFGGQYNQLIARRVRDEHVYCEVLPFDASADRIKSMSPKGIIFTGGPASVYVDGAPVCDNKIFELGIPILGICYGAQLIAHLLGGKVSKAPMREYGKADVDFNVENKLFKGIEERSVCWMSHTDYVEVPPEGFDIIGRTVSCPAAAIFNNEKQLYGVQFHPEVAHTQRGSEILHNFLFEICGCSEDWLMSSFVEQSIAVIKQKVGNNKVLCALSGGVDSCTRAGNAPPARIPFPTPREAGADGSALFPRSSPGP
jgi:GMP synthase (glutamine-hydrolysing)